MVERGSRIGSSRGLVLQVGSPEVMWRSQRESELRGDSWTSAPRSRDAKSPQERPGSRRSLPGSLSEKSPSMEPSAATPFRVTVTISASPSPPGLGCCSATPRAPFLEPHGPGEHPASLVLGLPQPPPQGLHQAPPRASPAGPQPQLPPHPAGVPERRRHRRRRRGQ
uniref:Uncharacterized protein n=1 Tax=Ursus americanus TaxID=9643 RepID=A0A452QQZ5_URSAM